MNITVIADMLGPAKLGGRYSSHNAKLLYVVAKRMTCRCRLQPQGLNDVATRQSSSRPIHGIETELPRHSTRLKMTVERTPDNGTTPKDQAREPSGVNIGPRRKNEGE